MVAELESGKEAARKGNELAFRTKPRESGAYVPDVTSLELSPGDYLLEITMRDVGSGKWGRYQQKLAVPGYAETLAVSDLELAYMVDEEQVPAKFRKGDVRVVPMPSRNYKPAQGVFLYYEVYGLEVDSFGRTRYKVSYRVHSDMHRRASWTGALASAVRRFVSSGEEEIVISYDRSGASESEPIWIGLDPSRIKTGLYQVTVVVSDLVGGKEARKAALFQLE